MRNEGKLRVELPVMTPIRVLIADDYALYREGLASLLAAESDFEVVGEAKDGLQAVEMALEVKPDVIVMDVSMPVMDGLEATRRIKSEIPDAKIVILTVSDGETRLLEALESGALGYLPQKIEPQVLYRTLRRVVHGEAPVSRGIAARLLEEFDRRDRSPTPVASPLAVLTAGERVVLEEVAQGRTRDEIAAKMAISETAVEEHLKHVLEKLRRESRVRSDPSALR
jgi:DNA-binding NarL/FixJ family response regulator